MDFFFFPFNTGTDCNALFNIMGVLMMGSQKAGRILTGSILEKARKEKCGLLAH